MLRVLTGTLLLALALPALADTPSYNYANAGYQRVELDFGGGADVDGDGFGLGGSFEVAENWHIAGSYSTVGFDFDIDLNQLQIGGGYHTDISDITSFYADLLFVNFEIDAGAIGSVDESGYGIAIGVRSNATESLELEAALAFVDLGNGADSTAIAGAAWYEMGDTFSLGITVGFEEDVTNYGIGARIYF